MNKVLSAESGKQILDLSRFTSTINDTQYTLIDGCAFMKFSRPDVVVESSLMVIGLLSYVHAKKNYAELCETMNNVLAYYSNELVNSESKLVRARYAQFLGYLVDMMYK